MERGSDKHSARLDDELASETASITHGAPVESRAEEWHQAEPAGEDEPPVSPFPAGHDEAVAPGAFTPGEIEARSELARWLPPHCFPGVREQLIGAVIDADAPTAVVDRLRDLAAGREYVNVGDVWTALGGREEPAP